MSKIHYTIEPFYNFIEEFKELETAHWEDAPLLKGKLVKSCNYDMYLQLNEIGVIHTLTARDEDEVLIGYLFTAVHPHLHYQEHTTAMVDLFYVSDKYRGRRVGKNMLEFLEEDLKEIGVDAITIGMKVSYPFDKLCKSLGYEYTERLYSKYIGE
jgi:GNAT superfamily N-acetyltransferase